MDYQLGEAEVPNNTSENATNAVKIPTDAAKTPTNAAKTLTNLLKAFIDALKALKAYTGGPKPKDDFILGADGLNQPLDCVFGFGDDLSRFPAVDKEDTYLSKILLGNGEEITIDSLEPGAGAPETHLQHINHGEDADLHNHREVGLLAAALQHLLWMSVCDNRHF